MAFTKNRKIQQKVNYQSNFNDRTKTALNLKIKNKPTNLLTNARS